MGRTTVQYFTFSTDDAHPADYDTLKQKCEKWAMARHDKPEENSPHTHFVGFLTTSTRTEIKYIAKWANLPENMIEIVRSKAGMINYLDHHNEPNKVQYDHSIIESNFKVDEFLNIEIKKIEKKKSFNQKEEFIQGVIIDIINGKIKRYNLFDNRSEEEKIIISDKKTRIDNAFKSFEEIKSNEKDRSMKCIYIQGESGSGKTLLAKNLPMLLGMIEDKKQLYITSSGKNKFDDYRGQPVVICDDFRASDSTFVDFLKLTDNNTSSKTGARFYNVMLNADLIIFTSIVPFSDFINELNINDSESIEQIYRRFDMLIKVIRTSKENNFIEAQTFARNEDTNKFDFTNPLPSIFPLPKDTFEAKNTPLYDLVKQFALQMKEADNNEIDEFLNQVKNGDLPHA